MKRLIATSMLVLVLSVCEPALSADITGLYVAPKVIWSYQENSASRVSSNSWFSPYDPDGPIRGMKGGRDGSDAWGGALAVGYDFKSKFGVPVRAELEYAMRSQSKTKLHALGMDTDGDYDDIANTRKLTISSLFANVFYDINTGTKFTPYVGGGVGVAQIRVKDHYYDQYNGNTDPDGAYQASSRRVVDNFAWNLAAGVAYSFDSNWSLDLGYRYSDFGMVRGGHGRDYTGNSSGDGYIYQTKSRVTAHEVMLGARYTF